jgi:diguanylate cyclase (GGDEF)-like protein
MRSAALVFSLPQWRATQWLTDAGHGVPQQIRVALIASLFGTFPIFLGGVVNTILVSGVILTRLPGPAFQVWFACEVLVYVARLIVLLRSYRNARLGRSCPTDIYVVLAVLWAGTVGYGCLISMLSGDWVAATLACLSAGAMVGGICFRNFGAPRLASIMILLSLGPACVGAALSGEPVLYVILFQIPFYLLSMAMASHRLNEMLVATMLAEQENEKRAKEDGLTGLSNRTGLLSEIDRRLAGGSSSNRFALLYMDLDGFKTVNDRHGHASGDELLIKTSERLRNLLESKDMAARVGGDEFVLVRDGIDRQTLFEFAQKVIAEIGHSSSLSGGAVVSVGASVGISIAPHHGDSAHKLLQAADKALYDAKASGKNRYALADANSRIG